MPILLPSAPLLTALYGQTAPAPEKVTTAPPLAGYPSLSDAEFAQKQGFGYGTPYESYVEGHGIRMLNNTGMGHDLHTVMNAAGDPAQTHLLTVDPASQGGKMIAALFNRAALAANRDPIASLGFDPRHMSFDPTTKNMTLGGAYTPENDQVYVADGGQSQNPPSAMVHESIHRGINMLRQDPALKSAFSNLPDEESIVRYLMATKIGDPEKGTGNVSDRQRSAALEKFNGHAGGDFYRPALDQLEQAAIQALAKRNPRGPH